MIELFQIGVSQIKDIVWGAPMLILLIGTHCFLTFRLKWIQQYIGKAIKLSITKDNSSEGDVSQFGALTTALAATIGTGNIVGVATAIALGGPGAVFWCWITGIFGMATKYSEGLLAVKYRVKTSDGTMLGGPMYALENGLKMKWLGVFFAIFGSLAAFGIGSSTQANSLSLMMKNEFGISPFITGVVISILIAIVIISGVKSIARVCESLVPFMSVFYILGCITILVINRSYLLETISLIFSRAFSAKAASGGFIGSTLMTAARFGIARGLFSNESGMGSAPIAAAAAKTKNPVRQALVSMTGTFWDTVIVCAITGLVLISSIIKNPQMLEGLTGGELTSAAFAQIPLIGPIVLNVGLAIFVFSTILGWSYYGERCVEYLLGKKYIFPYKFFYVGSTFLGSIMSLTLVWDVADIMNALMAIPNLISLLLLNGVVKSETEKYLWNDQLDMTSNDSIIIR